MIWAIARDRWPFLPGVPAMQDKEIAERFGQDFTLEHVQQGKGRWIANWYTLRRRENHPGKAEGIQVGGEVRLSKAVSARAATEWKEKERDLGIRKAGT